MQASTDKWYVVSASHEVGVFQGWQVNLLFKVHNTQWRNVGILFALLLLAPPTHALRGTHHGLLLRKHLPSLWQWELLPSSPESVVV